MYLVLNRAKIIIFIHYKRGFTFYRICIAGQMSLVRLRVHVNCRWSVYEYAAEA